MKLKRASVALLLAALLVVATGAALAWSQGYRLFAIQTGSMSPAFPIGALVIDAPPSADGPSSGDVITFRTGAGFVTHRVVESTVGGLTTKGDANATDDPWTIPQASVVGRVIAVAPRWGYVLVFFKQPAGVAAVVLGLSSIILLWQLFFPEESADEKARQSRSRDPGPPRPRDVATPPQGVKAARGASTFQAR